MTARCDNRTGAIAVKVSLRRDAVEMIDRPCVLDLYAGERGEMYDRIWKGYPYLGVDKRYRWPDDRRRFVADNADVINVIDLCAYNVFDFDAYGSPWGLIVSLIDMRPPADGERIAVVITDGAHKNRFGRLSRVQEGLLGMTRVPPKSWSQRVTHDGCLRAVIDRAKARLVWGKTCESKAGASGSHLMIYTALVLEGTSSHSTPSSSLPAE